MQIPVIEPGCIPPDPVSPDSLKGIPRQQTNPARRSFENWKDFVGHLRSEGVFVREGKVESSIFVTDAGGLAFGLPHGVVRPNSAEDISKLLKAAQLHRVPVTVRGGGLTTEGESVAFGGILLDMSSLNKVLKIDAKAMTVRTQAGIFWHQLAEILRRDGMDYLSAPLNLTASVGGTLGVGGIDVNSSRLGCSSDQAVELEVVTPTGEIMRCSETENPELFERVLLGYGQFGVITEAVLKIRKFSPLTMQYYYYASLRTAIEDLQMLSKADAADYAGILTILDRAITLLVAFDSDERRKEFEQIWKHKLRGHGELGFGLLMARYYLLRPWKMEEALYIASRRFKLFPEFNRPEFMRDGKIIDRTVVFSRAVWKFWGGRQMVIPDLSAKAEKFVEAVERGNAVCRKYFKYYTLYCVGIKLKGNLPRYEMSCIPQDASDIAYGCEFEPMLRDTDYSRDYLQSFKNEIYDIGVDMGLSYYRFGGMMKGYIRRVFGDEMVDKHLAMKKAADPAMILNPDVIF
ncbi:MAG: FAD-binding oxidoreductase [Nitrospirae bacterium]|nr:MAG: FAD-binding oxidoreductase [Nitrospirota bacterium]